MVKDEFSSWKYQDSILNKTMDSDLRHRAKVVMVKSISYEDSS